LVTAVVGCLLLVLILVLGPWIGCAACAFCGGVGSALDNPQPRPASPASPRRR
jgi:hypothetical protein